jgi:hypothetical protein
MHSRMVRQERFISLAIFQNQNACMQSPAAHGRGVVSQSHDALLYLLSVT